MEDRIIVKQSAAVIGWEVGRAIADRSATPEWLDFPSRNIRETPYRVYEAYEPKAGTEDWYEIWPPIAGVGAWNFQPLVTVPDEVALRGALAPVLLATTGWRGTKEKPWALWAIQQRCYWRETNDACVPSRTRRTIALLGCLVSPEAAGAAQAAGLPDGIEVVATSFWQCVTGNAFAEKRETGVGFVVGIDAEDGPPYAAVELPPLDEAKARVEWALRCGDAWTEDGFGLHLMVHEELGHAE